MNVAIAKCLVALAPLLLCSCMVNSLKAAQPATTMRLRIDDARLSEYAMRVSTGEVLVKPDADGVFTVELPEVEGRCVRELLVFGWTFGRDPVPKLEVMRNDSSRVRHRVPITKLDELPVDAEGVRILK